MRHPLHTENPTEHDASTAFSPYFTRLPFHYNTDCREIKCTLAGRLQKAVFCTQKFSSWFHILRKRRQEGYIRHNLIYKEFSLTEANTVAHLHAAVKIKLTKSVFTLHN